MKTMLKTMLLALMVLAFSPAAQAQIYTKLDGLVDHPNTQEGVSFRVQTRQVSAAYTVKLKDDFSILANATSAGFTIALPAAGTNTTTRVFYIQKTDSTANAVTIDGNGSETIDGSTTLVLRNQYQGALIQAGFGGWHVIALTPSTGIGVLTAGATPAFAPFGTLTAYSLTPAEGETIAATTTYAVKGREYALIVLTSGTSSYTLTFGTNFKSTGTLATGTADAKRFVVKFIFDGTYFVETSRTTAM